MGDEEQYVTVREMAQRMGVSRMTVYRLIHGGTLPAARFGQRLIRVRETDFRAYLDGAGHLAGEPERAGP